MRRSPAGGSREVIATRSGARRPPEPPAAALAAREGPARRARPSARPPCAKRLPFGYEPRCCAELSATVEALCRREEACGVTSAADAGRQKRGVDGDDLLEGGVQPLGQPACSCVAAPRWRREVAAGQRDVGHLAGPRRCPAPWLSRRRPGKARGRRSRRRPPSTTRAPLGLEALDERVLVLRAAGWPRTRPRRPPRPRCGRRCARCRP